MDFGISQDQAELVRVARKVAAELAPGYVQRDREAGYAWASMKLLAKAGLLGINAPVTMGGQGAGELEAALVIETIAEADYSAATMIISSGSRGKLLDKFASERIKREWGPKLMSGEASMGFAFTEPGAGSDISAVSTRARRDGDSWLIRGEKSSMSNSEAEAAITLALTDQGPCLFVVPLDAPGVTVAPFEDMGNRAIGRAVVTMEDVRVPDDARIGDPGGGVRTALQVLGTSKVLVCAACIGAASASLNEAVEWAQSRVAYGAPLAARQGVAFPLVDRMIELESARLLVQKALWLADNGRDFRREAAMAKAWIPALASRICHEALLTMGHVAYSSEHPAQVRLRDMIGTELGEGPANTQRMVLARQIFGATPS